MFIGNEKYQKLLKANKKKLLEVQAKQDEQYRCLEERNTATERKLQNQISVQQHLAEQKEAELERRVAELGADGVTNSNLKEAELNTLRNQVNSQNETVKSLEKQLQENTKRLKENEQRSQNNTPRFPPIWRPIAKSVYNYYITPMPPDYIQREWRCEPFCGGCGYFVNVGINQNRHDLAIPCPRCSKWWTIASHLVIKETI